MLATNDIVAGQYVMIAITDTGVGMSSEIVERAFDPFFTTKGVGKGTGLGLSQTHGFVLQSNGHIKIYSEVGHGTTFKLYLPRYFGADGAAWSRPSIIADAPRGGTSNEIIFVVEDEDRVRMITVDALRELGYSVVHAASGQEALDLLETHADVTLLFTDVVMPGMTGRQLADKVKVARPDLRVLFTTGYTRNAVVHNGTLDVGTNFLAKPVLPRPIGGEDPGRLGFVRPSDAIRSMDSEKNRTDRFVNQWAIYPRYCRIVSIDAM